MRQELAYLIDVHGFDVDTLENDYGVDTKDKADLQDFIGAYGYTEDFKAYNE